MRGIAKIIGAARLDTYVDYARTREMRMLARVFAAPLPSSLKLSA